jgi:hypothetical protein
MVGKDALQTFKKYPEKKNNQFFLCSYFPTIFKAFSGIFSLQSSLKINDIHLKYIIEVAEL